MMFYFIIKSLFSIRFFKTLAAPCSISIVHRLLSLSIVETSFVASYSIDTLNVIYRSHTSILLACLPQKYVHLSPYTSLITRNTEECFKKNYNDENFLQKSSTEKKIAAIFYFCVSRVCKTQFHWSSRMEWQGINQSALATYQPY